MTKKMMFFLFAVLLVAVFLAACHPHRRHHRGCESYGPFGADPVRSQVSETMTFADFGFNTADRS